MKKTAVLIFIILLTQKLYADPHYESARKQYTFRNFDNARELFLKSAEGYSNGNSYYFLGEIEKLEENYDEALQYYEKAVKEQEIEQKYLRNAYWNLIVISEQRGDINKVIQICRDMWERLRDESAKKRIEDTIDRYLWTDNEEAAEMYREGLILQDSGDPEGAEQHFNEALRISSSFLAPKVELGLSAYRSGDLRRAAYYLSPVASDIPFYADIHLVMGDIAMKVRNWRRTVYHLNMVFEFGLLDKNTEFTALLRRAGAHHKLRNYEEAGEDIERALEINPGSLSAIILLASINLDRNNKEEALENLKRAERIDARNPFVLINTGEILYENEDPGYVEYFQRLFDSREQEEPLSGRLQRAYTCLVEYYYENENYRKALEIRGAITVTRRDARLNRITAHCYYYIREYESAISFFEMIRLQDEDHLKFAKAHYLNGDPEKAKNYLAVRFNNRELIESAEKDTILSRVVEDIRREREAARTPSPARKPEKEPETEPLEPAIEDDESIDPAPEDESDTSAADEKLIPESGKEPELFLDEETHSEPEADIKTRGDMEAPGIETETEGLPEDAFTDDIDFQ